MNDVSKKTLEKIKNEHIYPKPRWYFLTRDYFIWIMFAITTLLGGIAFGMILFITSNLDWDIYKYLGISLSETVVTNLPYLWIALLIFFLFVTYYNFIHTRKGYRYQFIFIFLISLLVSILLGFGFYQYGWTEKVERQLRLKFPGYHNMVYTSEKQWMQPEKGLLSGTIKEFNPKSKYIRIKDYSNNEWKIDISQAVVRGNISITEEEDLEIKVLGKKVTEDVFEAKEIRIIMRGFHQGKGRKQ